jgi:hypothetical protein
MKVLDGTHHWYWSYANCAIAVELADRKAGLSVRRSYERRCVMTPFRDTDMSPTTLWRPDFGQVYDGVGCNPWQSIVQNKWNQPHSVEHSTTNSAPSTVGVSSKSNCTSLFSVYHASFARGGEALGSSRKIKRIRQPPVRGIATSSRPPRQMSCPGLI